MEILLDCNACKSDKTMKPTTIPRFNLILRLIGMFIVIPSILGIIIAVAMLISSFQVGSEMGTSSQTDYEAAGAAIGASIGFGFSMFVGISSLISGAIGWIFLLKRKVFKCINCGFILDRA